MTNNRRERGPSVFGSSKRVFRPLINYAFRGDRENFARYPKWRKCYPCKFLFPSEFQSYWRNIVIWSYLLILAKIQKRERERGGGRATRNRSERKRKDRRCRDDTIFGGRVLGSLFAPISTRGLYRGSDQPVFVSQTRNSAASRASLFSSSGTLGDPDLGLFVASGNTRRQDNQKLSRCFPENLRRSWESKVRELDIRYPDCSCSFSFSFIIFAQLDWC